MLIYNTYFSFSDFLHSPGQSLGPSVSLQMAQCIPFHGWVILHCIYVPHLLYPFLHWRTFRLLPFPGRRKSATTNIGMHVSFEIMVFSGYMELSLWFSAFALTVVRQNKINIRLSSLKAFIPCVSVPERCLEHDRCWIYISWPTLN